MIPTLAAPDPTAAPMLTWAPVDRAAHLRSDAAALRSLWCRPDARVLRVDGMAGVLACDGRSLAWSPAARIGQPQDGSDPGERYFLGLDGEGVPHFALNGPFVLAPEESVISLRDIGPWMPPGDAGMFAHAVALAAWHGRHQFCPRCGGATRACGAGHSRACGQCGSRHFPRMDPTVVMLVLDESDRLLLAHNRSWPTGRYSTLAGFMDAAESAEATVAREVFEEVGLVVNRIEYEGSQPWPFPASTMFAFRAHATESALSINTDEITQAAWFTREQLHDAVGRGAVGLPSSVSIARWQIERWFGGPLPTSHDW